MNFNTTISNVNQFCDSPLWQAAEDYLHVGQKAYEITARDGIALTVKESPRRQNVIVTALKVLSFCTLIFPAIAALIVKAAYRNRYTINIASSAKPQNDPVSESKPNPTKELKKGTKKLEGIETVVNTATPLETPLDSPQLETTKKETLSDIQTTERESEELLIRKQIAEKKLSNIWTAYKAKLPTQKHLNFKGASANFFEDKNSSTTPCFADAGMANIILPLENSPHAFFLPHSYYISCFRSNNDEDIASEKGFSLLKEALTEAFILGKKVVTRLLGEWHAVAAVFQPDGTFKIIDSMGSMHIIDETSLAEKLNKAQIKDQDGKAIVFSGKYINVGIQKGGNQCQRFATLNAHTMVVEDDSGAYEKVTGAFKAGLLKRFEDYKNIGQAKKESIGTDIPVENYLSFMDEWACWTQNMQVKNWMDLPHSQIGPRESVTITINWEKQDVHRITSCCLKNSNNATSFPGGFTVDLQLPNGESPKSIQFIVEKGNKEVPATPTLIESLSPDAPLGSLIPQEQGRKRFVVLIPGKENTEIYELNDNEKLMIRLDYASGVIRKRHVTEELVRA